jgi:dipeptidyl aminopeptidase/acylaminoacyl peptidase
MRDVFLACCGLCAASVDAAPAAPIAADALSIPKIEAASPRAITIDDLLSLRHIDTLRVAPDGRHFAIFLRQADANSNRYRTALFVGDVDRGDLRFVGEGGEARPAADPTGHIVGDFGVQPIRWSPDGRWLAYTRTLEDSTQLWLSRAEGGVQKQLTHNAANVQQFAWNAAGDGLYFATATPRIDEDAWRELKERNGYNYNSDLFAFTNFMELGLPVPAQRRTLMWTVDVASGAERVAGEREKAALDQALASEGAGGEEADAFVSNAASAPLSGKNGARAWLKRSGKGSRLLRVVVSFPGRKVPVECEATACTGVINKIWWSESGLRILFWRNEGINDASHGFYEWSIRTGAVSRLIAAPDDDLRQCDMGASEVLICVRETKTAPAHVAAIDLRARKIRVIADVNPEYRNIRLGRVERFEWDTPRFAWNEPGGALAGTYPSRAYGYIMYPPDFAPGKVYPVFIDPYTAVGFNSSAGFEHPLHVYAANGFVVLNTAFPVANDAFARFGSATVRLLYSAELAFPHLSMLAESTLGGLDAAASRGFLDLRRVGIGGVSHGSFVPLHIMQKHDRIAAASISSPTWGPHEYYWATRRGREAVAEAYGNIGYDEWQPKPVGSGLQYWSQIDIADHVDAIEAPIMMNLAAHETYALVRFMRHLDDAGKPYDAYVFRNETHIKWQPAHLAAILRRNLDWFRFWLEDWEDPDPSKSEQYARWHQLRAIREAQPQKSEE